MKLGSQPAAICLRRRLSARAPLAVPRPVPMPNTRAVVRVTRGSSDGRPGDEGGHNPRYNGGDGGVDGVHKAESAADETAGVREPD